MLLFAPAFDFCMPGCFAGIAAFGWFGVVCLWYRRRHIILDEPCSP